MQSWLHKRKTQHTYPAIPKHVELKQTDLTLLNVINNGGHMVLGNIIRRSFDLCFTKCHTNVEKMIVVRMKLLDHWFPGAGLKIPVIKDVWGFCPLSVTHSSQLSPIQRPCPVKFKFFVKNKLQWC